MPTRRAYYHLIFSRAEGYFILEPFCGRERFGGFQGLIEKWEYPLVTLYLALKIYAQLILEQWFLGRGRDHGHICKSAHPEKMIGVSVRE
jgi:hypothetical protein